MKRTKFEIEHAMAQNAAFSSDRQEICGGKTDYLRFDAEREPINNDNKGVATVAWMKMLELIR